MALGLRLDAQFAWRQFAPSCSSQVLLIYIAFFVICAAQWLLEEAWHQHNSNSKFALQRSRYAQVVAGASDKSKEEGVRLRPSMTKPYRPCLLGQSTWEIETFPLCCAHKQHYNSDASGRSKKKAQEWETSGDVQTRFKIHPCVSRVKD